MSVCNDWVCVQCAYVLCTRTCVKLNKCCDPCMDDFVLFFFVVQLQGDPNLMKMLSLGEYHSGHNHMNISTELKVVQQKFKDFPSDVKTNLDQTIKGTLIAYYWSPNIPLFNLQLEYTTNASYNVCIHRRYRRLASQNVRIHFAVYQSANPDGRRILKACRRQLDQSGSIFRGRPGKEPLCVELGTKRIAGSIGTHTDVVRSFLAGHITRRASGKSDIRVGRLVDGYRRNRFGCIHGICDVDGSTWWTICVSTTLQSARLSSD